MVEGGGEAGVNIMVGEGMGERVGRRERKERGERVILFI